jgi:CRP-like cAMP-binding protein
MKELINQIEKYIELSNDEKETVQNWFQEISIQKGETILLEGQICQYLYFVSKGIFRQYIDDGQKELTIHFNGENTFICDFNSFTAKKPSIKTIEALENGSLYRISYNDLDSFYKKITNGEKFGRLLLEEAFNHTVHHIYSLKRDRPECRYTEFTKQYKAFQQRIPQYHIASFLGVTPQSLSRIRKRIAAQ